MFSEANIDCLKDSLETRVKTLILSILSRFYQNLQAALTAEKLQKLQIPDPPNSQELKDPSQRLETERGEKGEEDEEEKRSKSSVYKRRRKRGQQNQTVGRHGDRDSSVPELDDCLDLFT